MIIVNDRQQFLKEVSLHMIPNYSTCVELGVFRGDFSKMIFDILKPSRLFLVDPFEHSLETYGPGQITTAYSDEGDFKIVQDRFKGVSQVTIFKGYSFDVVNHAEDGSIDFAYHDASHLYKDLKRDLNEWLPKMKKDSIIAGHDYTENYKDYVGKAVDEFCAEQGFEMFLFNEQGGDFALRKL